MLKRAKIRRCVRQCDYSNFAKVSAKIGDLELLWPIKTLTGYLNHYPVKLFYWKKL